LALTIFGLLLGTSQSSKPPPFVNASTSFVALLAAMIFVTHPIQTQAVTYVVQRYTSMAAMFYMASVLFYLRARMIQGVARQHIHFQESERRKSNKKEIKTKPKGKSPNEKGKMSKREDEKKTKSKVYLLYALSIICGMFAFLSKQNTASLPGAIILAEVLLVDRTWQGWKKKIPWFALFSLSWILFVALVSMHYSEAAQGGDLLEDVSGLMKDTETVGRWEYLCTQFNVLVVYIRLLFLPIQQNLDYAFLFRRGFFDSYTPLAFLFLTALALLGIRQVKKRPVISMGIFWFFITLSVESSIIPIRDALFEHRLYLPVFGFTLIVSILLISFFQKDDTGPSFFRY
jgi:hypothetical protein